MINHVNINVYLGTFSGLNVFFKTVTILTMTSYITAMDRVKKDKIKDYYKLRKFIYLTPSNTLPVCGYLFTANYDDKVDTVNCF